MALEIPHGREARQAWQALSPQAREAAFAAAKQGVPPIDVGTAWAAAGYGRLMARRLRYLRLLAPVLVVVLAVPGAVLLVAVRAPFRYAQGAIVGVGVVAVAAVFVAIAAAGRYQRLYSSGLLALQATEVAARPVAAVAASGTSEVPVRRGPVVASLAFFAGLGLLFWLGALVAPAAVVVAVAFTALVGFLGYAVWPALRHPVLARFTPAGWELPTVRMGGPWSAVREIRVRPISTRGPVAASPQLATYRAVALMLDDPDGQLARLPALRRVLVRRTMKRYGSPAVIVATPRRTIPLTELVTLLQRYTDAPVRWS